MYQKLYLGLVFSFVLFQVKAQQSNLTVETIAANVFNTTVTPGSYESSNGLTYFIDKGTIANVSVTGVAGKAVWTDGTAAGTHSVNIPAIKEHLGIIDSAYYGVDELGQLFKFTSGTGITVLQESFQKACEFVRLGNDYYFLGVPTSDTLASIWKVDAQGVFSQMATVNGVNASVSNLPLLLKTNGQYLLGSVGDRLCRFDANSSVSVILVAGLTNYRKLIVDNLGSVTYFCVANRIYQTDGTQQGTFVPTSMVNFEGISSFSVFQNCLFIFVYNGFFIGSHGYNTETRLIIYNGRAIISINRLSASNVTGIFQDFNVANTFVSPNGKLYIFSNRLETLLFSGAPVDVFELSSPYQPLRLIGTIRHYRHYRTHNLKNFLLNGKLFFDAFTEPNNFLQSFQIPARNGYYELDAIGSGSILPVSLQNARLLTKSFDKVFGHNEFSLQVLAECPQANLRPLISNPQIDTVTGMLRIRWEGPSDGSVNSYQIMRIDSTSDIATPYIQGTAIGLIAGVNGQRYYEFLDAIPSTPGEYNYGLKAISMFGACADTALYIGALRRCGNLPSPQVSVSVTQIVDLYNATITVVANPENYIRTISVMKNGTVFRSITPNGSGVYSIVDNQSYPTNTYSVVVSSNNPCYNNWVVPVTVFDTFSCSSFIPTIYFDSVSLSGGLNGCPTLSVDYTIQSNQILTVDLDYGGSHLSRVLSTVGTSNHRGLFQIPVHGVSTLGIWIASNPSCPNYSYRYPIALNADSLFYKIDSLRIEELSTRNQLKLSWKTRNQTLIDQVFDIYRDAQLIATNLSFGGQDSVFSFVDSLVLDGYRAYQVRSTNYTCNAIADVGYQLNCDPANPSVISDAMVREVSANQRLITWKVGGGRTRKTLTKATIKQNTPLGIPQVLKPEDDITNNPLTDTYSAIFNCPDKYTYLVKVFATNPYSACANDTETILCDCNSFQRNDISIVFPNPVQNTFTIYYPQGIIKAGVQLYDGVGALVREYGEQPNYCNLDMSGLPQGFYYLRLQYSTSFEMVKIEKL